MMVKNEEERLNAIRAAIKSKRLRWKAGPTEISSKSKEDRKKMLGAIIDEDRVKDILRWQKEKESKRSRSITGPVAPSPKWDWRNVSGWNWTTPIRNQGLTCCSCVAFAVIGALEMLLKKQAFNDPVKNPDLSEAHLFFCNNGQCGEGNVSHDKLLDYLMVNGVPDEACYPYTPIDQPCKTCPDWKARIVFGTKLKAWSRVTDINEMKALLRTHGCLVSEYLAVFDDFDAYTGGIYEHAWGEFEGGHSVAVVGYDDAEGCWICKNSYGTGWGETYPPNGDGPAGWFRIAYGECGIDWRMYRMDLDLPRGWMPPKTVASASQAARDRLIEKLANG